MSEHVVKWTERAYNGIVHRSVSYGSEQTANAVAEALKTQTVNIENVQVDGQDK